MCKFIHLRNHSEYSLCSGTIRLKKLVALSNSLKIPAASITDCHNLFGALEFSMAAAKNGVQPIVGCEVIIDGSNFLFNSYSGLRTNEQREEGLCKIVILAKTDQGFLNLIALISDSYIHRQSAIDPHITLEALEKHKEGLIILSGGPEGILGKAILNQSKNLDEITQYFLDNFKDDFYIEILRHGQEDELNTEDKFLELAYKYNIPLVATNDCYFLKKDMFEAQDALSCIGASKYVTQTDRKRLSPEHYFKSEEEMIELFRDLPEAIENTIVIAKKIHTCARTRKPTFPHFDLPEGVTEADEMIRLSRLGLEERLEKKFLLEQITDLKEQEIVRKQYFDQLEFEINTIIGMHFQGYFLIVADFIVWSKTHGVPIGPGRGSGAGSVVAWALKITNLDPIKFSLFFERFLNPERVSLPDFDVDFCQRGRARSIEYVQEKYGKDMVAQIITFGKLQAKAVVKDVGRVLQMGYSEVDKISKMIPFGNTLEEALEQDDELKKQRATDPEIQRLLNIALQLEGLNRHTSVHAAGIVIGDKPLKEICPLYYDDNSDMPVTQYDKKYAEEVGLVKFDFLGLKTLTTIKDTIDFIKEIRNVDVDIDNIPLDDSGVYKMLQIPDSIGVFQIESSGMQGMLKQIKPDNIEDIVALISLFRPGPLENIPVYIKRKHGVEKVEYMHPKMEPILKDTFGIIIYQEQVMNIAKTLAGYTLGGADLLRRAMGKKIKEEMDKQRAVFVEGCRKFNDINEKLSNEIFDLLAKFAEYGFNKAHAASYAVISYQTAYLKYHYMVEFLTATINMEIGLTDKVSFYLQDVKKHNIKILNPDINRSYAYFRPELIDMTDKYEPEITRYHNNKEIAIRYGLGAIKGVGIAVVDEIVAERNKNGEFKSIFDFCERMDPKIVNKKTIESLAKCGAFDLIHSNRRQISDSYEILSNYCKSQKQDDNSKQISLFEAWDIGVKNLPKLVNIPDWEGYERTQEEFNAFGFYLLNHPLSSIEDQLIRKNIVFSKELEDPAIEDNCTIKVAGVIIATSIKAGPRGRYAYVTLSDNYGLFDVGIFNNDLITPNKDLLNENAHNHVVFICNIRKDDSGTKLAAKEIITLDDFIKNFPVENKIIKPSTRNFNKKSLYAHEEKIAAPIEYYQGIRIYIQNERQLEQVYRIISNCVALDKEKFTKITLTIEANGTQKDVTLPDNYFITPQNLYRLRFTTDISRIDKI